MGKNILVSTFGKSETLVFELLGFTNPDECLIYQNHPNLGLFDRVRSEHGVFPVSEVWLISTSDTLVLNAYDACKNSPLKDFVQFRFFTIENLKDLQTQEDRECMRELIYRTVLKAYEESEKKGGKLFLSMVGGFKTMSADIQEAGNIFGFQTLLHCIVDGPPFSIAPSEACAPLDSEVSKKIVPVVVDSYRRPAVYLYHSDIKASKFPVEDSEIRFVGKEELKSNLLVKEISKKRREADIVLSNLSFDSADCLGNFRALARLHPRILDKLRKEKIGGGGEKDLFWLRSLPKAELHCHFGGILAPKDMVSVAQEETERINEYSRRVPEYKEWLRCIRNYVEEGKVDSLCGEIVEKEKLRRKFGEIPEPLCVCGFLSQFAGCEELLEKVIYREHSKNFSDIGIEKYEKLGDLQGSALMQSARCIRKACDILINYCERNSILYLELRCSPINYTRGGLSAEEVVNILLEKFSNAKLVCITLLFIASRHGKMSDVFLHIELFEKLLKKNIKFKDYFVGFDLAGAESVRTPKELRFVFESIHYYCQNITIHAGETDRVERIWEAVYHLSADRIGHGLKLKEKKELLDRFVDRRIAVEMCPSSNFQICKYKNFLTKKDEGEVYPLKFYMDEGIRVTVNTDNPGISRTDLTNEYLLAAQMTQGGLSRWEILTLIKNAFSAAFLPLKKRREILKIAEEKVMELIKSEYES